MSIQTAGPGHPGPALPHIDPRPAAAGMLEVIGTLAADPFTGRRVGTAGGRAAAEWLAAHLTSLGAQVTLDEFAVNPFPGRAEQTRNGQHAGRRAVRLSPWRSSLI